MILAYKLTKCFLALSSSILLVCMLGNCGGGGGGSSSASDIPLTEEEEQAVREESERSPENLDVPDEVVPHTFQGKRVDRVELRLEGESYGGFRAPVIHFTLKPGGDVAEAVMDKDDEQVRVDSAHWEGQSAGTGTRTISYISIEGQSTDFRALRLTVHNATVSSKKVEGLQTVYDGTVETGTCSLGGIRWQSFSPEDTLFRLIYYLSDN